ncbi:unnamed protein product [Rotaria socialis]|uniref:Uncharacterized protein n=1 Tax=Rotaria socialis TaxID=392032 RepID=A0A821USK9_9BILA|nr:unnamed protein product [Rotaria socialis]CAF4894369.1 unnamed protein product [Rotaria socialis]
MDPIHISRRRNQINRRRLLEEERRQRQQRQQQQQAQCERVIFALRAFNCLPMGVTSTGPVPVRTSQILATSPRPSSTNTTSTTTTTKTATSNITTITTTTIIVTPNATKPSGPYRSTQSNKENK